MLIFCKVSIKFANCERNTDFSSAPCAINAARSTFLGLIGHGYETDIRGVESHGTILKHVARDADISDTLSLVKGRVRIAEVHETLEVQDMSPNVHDLKLLLELSALLYLCLYILAVGTRLHSVKCYHSFYSFNQFCMI